MMNWKNRFQLEQKAQEQYKKDNGLSPYIVLSPETLKKAYKLHIPKPKRVKKAIQRCADCGEPGELTGHMTCQYPQDH